VEKNKESFEINLKSEEDNRTQNITYLTGPSHNTEFLLKRSIQDAYFSQKITSTCRAERPKSKICGSTLAGIGVRIPPEASTSVSCECIVLSRRGLCDEPNPRPESTTKSGMSVCEHKTSKMRRPRPERGSCATKKNKDYVHMVKPSTNFS
jgi:hypothetical protein